MSSSNKNDGLQLTHLFHYYLSFDCQQDSELFDPSVNKHWKHIDENTLENKLKHQYEMSIFFENTSKGNHAKPNVIKWNKWKGNGITKLYHIFPNCFKTFSELMIEQKLYT